MLKTMRFLVLLSLFLPVQLAALADAETAAPSASPVDSQAEVRREVASAQGFSLVPPEGWVAYVPADESFMAFRAPAGVGGAGRFSPFFRIRVDPDLSDQGIGIDELGPFLKLTFDKLLPKWELDGEGFETLSGQKSYFISVRQDPVRCGCHDLQYYVPASRHRLFTLTFSVLLEEYAQYEPVFRQVARSIRLID
ncbi:MAG: hypothetical protein ACAI44_25200 [Candidatus Sericytochromatia bacterium]